MSYIQLQKDADGIVELIFDQQGEKVNKMGQEYIEAMTKAVNDLVAMKGEIKGVYVPFWLFDADANASMHFKATRTRSWRRLSL